jgi:hypothetical protein
MITESSTDCGETTWCHRFTKRHGLENESLLRSFIRTCKISNALDGTDEDFRGLYDYQKLHNALQFCCISTAKFL